MNSNQFKACFKAQLLAWLICLAGADAVAEPWPARYSNPKPLEDDVILPMPCDGAMAFRRIAVPSSGPLDDQAVVLGGDVEETQALEHNRNDFIAGSFSGDKGARYYLIGKYEVNELQYRSVMEDSCPKASTKQALPKNRVNWHDAVAFAHRYNLWLLEHAAESLPKDDGEAGFLRLPTEPEWEFALRGGIAVTSSEFRAGLFRMDQALDQYAWYSSPQSANGRLQLIGLLNPNPLGLHDMLGNLDEVVLEPFRLNKLDRLHGQAGGFTIRGGNYLTGKSDIRNSYRLEVPYYKGSELRRSKTTGMRLAVAAPVLTGKQRIEQVDLAWSMLGFSESASLQDQTGEDPLKQLDALNRALESEELEQEQLQREIKSLTEQLKINNQQRNDQRDRAAISALQLGAFLCSQVNQVGQLAAFHQKAAGNICEKLPAKCDAAKRKAAHHADQLSFYTRYYADTIVDTVFNYPYKVLAQQHGKLIQGLEVGQQSNLVYFADWHSQHLKQHADNGRISTEKWQRDCAAKWQG